MLEVVSTPGPPVPLSDIVLAGNRMTLRERALRVRRMAPRIAMIALATAISYLVARYVFGHQRPFFAPVSAVVCIGATLGQPARRAVQLALGVSVGVLIADAAIALIGTGAWQLSVVVFVTMCAVVFAGGERLALNQSASAAVLLSTLALPGDAFGLSRAGDAAIGAATALFFNFVLFPVHPVKLAQGALEPAARRIADVLDAVAEALAEQDVESAATALERARALERHSEDMRADVATSGEIAQLALARRGHRAAVTRYSAAVEDLTRAHTDVATLARGAKRLLDAGETAPAQVVEAVGDLALSARHVADAFGDPESRRVARESALHAATVSTAGLDRTRSLWAVMIVGQTRMTAHDLLRATGLSAEQARRRVRRALEEQQAPAA
jgi:uncharacterized membrane protein YgaE (UPF0421/DUF939 family)